MNKLNKRQFLKISGTALIGAPIVLSLSLPARAAMQHTVTIKGFKFDPETIDIAAGDTVVFENKDGAPHTATAKDQSWTTKTLNGGQSEEVTFADAGEFNYFCKFHPGMKAVVNVA